MKFDKYIARFTQTHWMFAVIALIFGTFFIALTPPLWGPDETVHFVRTYQISRGNIIEKAVDVGGSMSYGGGIPQSLISLNNLKDTDINDWKPGDTRQVDSMATYTKVGGVSLSEDRVVASPFGEITYPTVVYMAPALGVFTAGLFQPTILHLMYAARVATLIFYIMLVFISLYIIRKSSFRWIVFIIALLPSTLYQASVVSADPFLTSLCLLFFSLTYYISHTEKGVKYKHTVPLVVVATLIAFIKPPYMLFIFVLPFLHLNRYIPRWIRIFIRVGIPVVGVLIAAWIVFSLKSNPSMTPPGVNFSDQLHWILSHFVGYIYMILNSILTIDWVPQVIGIFGSSFIFVPMPIVHTLVSLLVLTAFIKLDGDPYSENSDTKLRAALYISISTASIIAVITTLFLAYTRVGLNLVSGVQGRYFIPILVFLLYGFRTFTRSRFGVAEKSALIAYPLIIILCLTISMLWYYKILY